MAQINQNRKTLAQVRAAFAKLRDRKGQEQAWYPKELKELALDALEQGASQAEVAQAAGVCVNSIKNWKNGRKPKLIKKRAAPVELKLIERRESDPIVRSIPSGEARIQFRSGVSIELPASCLSEDLLGILMRGSP